MFGNILKELRKASGMTQAELAKKIKVSASAIGMYEQNRREPDRETIIKLSTLFNVSPSILLQLEDYTPQNNCDKHQYYNQKNVRVNKASSKTQTLEQFIESANTLFMDASEEDRDLLYKTLSDIYFDSKEKNREKYNPNKNKQK